MSKAKRSSAPADTDAVCRARTEWQNNQTYYRAWHDLIDRELDYSLKLQHYVNDTGETKDKRRILPRGLQLYQIIRHKTARIAATPPYIECRAIDDQAPPETAGWAKASMEQVLFDPMKGYARCKKRMVLGAMAARAWAMAVEYDPTLDEILFRTVDPTKLYVAPGAVDMHDPRTPYVQEERYMRLGDIRAMGGKGPHDWKNAEDVRPDSQADDRVRRAPPTIDGTVKLEALNQAAAGEDSDLWATVLFTWYRKDPFDQTYERDLGVRDLEPNEQHMKCMTCGYEDHAYPRDEEGGLPPLGEACPDCGDVMSRVDETQETGTFVKYPNGLLTITAPICGVELYNDEWPVKLRSFPFWLFNAYDHPRDLYGQSDTSLNWSLQTISNYMLRQGFDQLRFNTDLILTPAEGLVDEFGKPFNFTDEAGRIAYFTDPMAATMTKHVQGSGLPASWAVYFNAIEGVYRANMGTSDLGLTPERSKDIPVGTLRQITETGEIPTDQHIRDLREGESVFLGVVWDFIRGTWSTARWVRLIGPDGAMMMQQVVGSQMPNFEIAVTATPTLRSLQVDELQTIIQWTQADPPTQRLIAKLANIPANYLREYEQDKQQWMMQQAALNPQGATNPQAGGSTPGGGPQGGAPQGGPAGPQMAPGPQLPPPVPLQFYNPADIAMHIIAKNQAVAALQSNGAMAA